MTISKFRKKWPGQKITFKVNRQNIITIACVVMILCLCDLANTADAQPSQENKLDSDRVGWTDLLFRTKKFFGDVTAEVKLDFITPIEAKQALIASPKGAAIPIPSAKVGCIAIHRSVDPTFGSKITEEDKVWFNPKNAGALGRIRFRRGDDDFRKVYRFTDSGVYRFRKEPKDKKESLLDPNNWTAHKNSFYSFDLARLGCSGVTERSLLIYLLSAANFSDSNASSLCVFGKRQLFRVQLRKQGIYPVKVNYIAKTQQGEVRKEETIKTIKIAIATEPMESDLDDPENFSFLGFHKDITVSIEPTFGIPIEVRGIIPRLGHESLKISEVHIRQKSD